MRIPPFFRRLFKFTSMDFETVGLATIYTLPLMTDDKVGCLGDDTPHNSSQKSFPKYILPRMPPKYRTSAHLTNYQFQKQTKDTYHRADPAFTYLLAFFLFLTGLAWGLAYAENLFSGSIQ